MTSTRQRNNNVAGLHSTGTLLWTRSRHGSTPIQLDFPEIWHNTPGQYIECTCKLIANITIMTNNIMTFNQVKCKQHHATHAVKPKLCIESLGLSYQQVASQLNSGHDAPLMDHSWFHMLLRNPNRDHFWITSDSPTVSLTDIIMIQPVQCN